MVGAFGILILFGFIWIVFHYISKSYSSVTNKIKYSKNEKDEKFHNKSFEIRDKSKENKIDTETKLSSLQELKNKGLINQETYEKEQLKILKDIK